MDWIQGAQVQLQSLKTACETLGVDPSLVQWAVTLVVGVTMAYATARRAYKVTRAAVKWVLPKDPIADRVCDELASDGVRWNEAVRWLNGSGLVSLKVLCRTNGDVVDVEAMAIGDAVGFDYSALSDKTKRRIREAAIDAVARCKARDTLRARQQILNALKAV